MNVSVYSMRRVCVLRACARARACVVWLAGMCYMGLWLGRWGTRTSDVADTRRRAHARARAMRDASMRRSHRRQCASATSRQSPVASR